MVEVALMLAALLHKPAGLVDAVYQAGGLDAVAVVETESQFNERAWRMEPEGTSYGLFQLYSKCHEQYRGDVLLHIVAGCAFLSQCLAKGGGSLAKGYSIFNSGTSWKSIDKGRKLERRRDSWAMYIYRRLR